MNKFETESLAKKRRTNSYRGYHLLLAGIFLLGCDRTQKDKSQHPLENKMKTGMDSIIVKANGFYNNDQYANAANEYTRIIALDSTNGEYYYKRGYSYSKLLLRKKAISDFQESIKFHFKSASSCYNIGINSSYDNDSLALLYFKKCLEIDPSYNRAKQEIVDCEERLKKKAVAP